MSSAKGCDGAVSTKPEITTKNNAKTTTTTSKFQKQNSTKSVVIEGTTNNARSTTSCSSFKMLPNRSQLSSPIKIFKQLGGKMASIIKMMSTSKKSCRKVTNSSERGANCAKPNTALNVDSHRAEAIDDCIQFIYLSSSLPRSNSVS